MKKLATIGALVLLIGFAAPAFAQKATGDPATVFTSTPAMDGVHVTAGPDPKQYGTFDYVQLNIPTVGFTPLADGQWDHFLNTSGWSNRSGGTNTAACAELHFPSGARVQGLDTWTNDTNAANNITYEVYKIDLGSSASTTIFSFTTSGTPGVDKAFRSFSPGELIINNDRTTYMVCVFSGAVGTSLQYAGATFWYHLQVSPGPATATFSDVPTTSGQFKFVEALVSAGITAGCSPGLYCPNQPVTRGQMAVFLATALGLHFQY